MASRAARNVAAKEAFEGRVHKWERGTVVVKKGTMKAETTLELLRWVMLEHRCPELSGPRYPHIKPLKKPVIKQPKPKGDQAAEGGAEQPAQQPAAPHPAAAQPDNTAAQARPREAGQQEQEQPQQQGPPPPPSGQAPQGEVPPPAQAPEAPAAGQDGEAAQATEGDAPQRHQDIGTEALPEPDGAQAGTGGGAAEDAAQGGAASAGGEGGGDAAPTGGADAAVLGAGAAADTDMADAHAGQGQG